MPNHLPYGGSWSLEASEVDEALRAEIGGIIDYPHPNRTKFIERVEALVKRRVEAAVRFVEAKNFGAMGPRLAGTGKTFDEVVDEITARTMERLEASR